MNAHRPLPSRYLLGEFLRRWEDAELLGQVQTVELLLPFDDLVVLKPHQDRAGFGDPVSREFADVYRYTITEERYREATARS